MKNAKKEMENKAQEAVKKAAEAVKEALVEANTALQIMQALSDDELDQVSGGESSWSGVPGVKPHPYPVDPHPENP